MDTIIDYTEDTPEKNLQRLENKIRRLEIEKDTLHSIRESESKKFNDYRFRVDEEFGVLYEALSDERRLSVNLQRIIDKLRDDLSNILCFIERRESAPFPYETASKVEVPSKVETPDDYPPF